MLDRGQRIARRLPAQRDRAIGENLHAGAAARIVRRIEARAAIKAVGPGAAHQSIVAQPAFQRFRPRAADQTVGILAAHKVLDIGQHIARRIAARARPAVEIGRHRRAAGRIGDGIDPAAAINAVSPRATDDEVIAAATVQGIVAAAAQQGVVASAAIQLVGIGIAQQHVVAGRTDDALNIGQRIARCVAARAGARSKVDRDRPAAG